MTNKEYLKQVFSIDRRINSKLEQIGSLRDLATKATSTLSDMPRSASRCTNSLEKIICNLIELENEINSDIDTLVDLKRDIIYVINEMQNPDHQTLIELRYLCLKNWEDIANEMGYSMQHIFRLHEKALKSISFIKHESKCDRMRVVNAL